MKERFHILMMLLLRTTNTSVFLKTQSTQPAHAGNAATRNQIWKWRSQIGLAFSGPPTIPRVSAVFLQGSIMVSDPNNQKSLKL